MAGGNYIRGNPSESYFQEGNNCDEGGVSFCTAEDYDDAVYIVTMATVTFFSVAVYRKSPKLILIKHLFYTCFSRKVRSDTLS